jgi:hypothetical protein
MLQPIDDPLAIQRVTFDGSPHQCQIRWHQAFKVEDRGLEGRHE